MRCGAAFLTICVCVGLAWGYDHTPQPGFRSVSNPRGYSWVPTEEHAQRFGSALRKKLPESVTAIPAYWDWRNVTVNGVSVNLCTRVLNQLQPHFCGSCWAEATTGALSDRFKIAAFEANGRTAVPDNVNLSPQILLDCGMQQNDAGTGLVAGSCYGGSSMLAYQWIMTYGITDETCAPFVAQSPAFWAELPCQSTMCRTCDRFGACSPVPNPPIYFASAHGVITPPTAAASNMTMVEAMQTEVLRGPITCTIWAHSASFENYTGGILVDHNKYPGTTHDIVVTGWGVSAEGLAYWVARNSFGTNWGIEGWFLIERGTDTLNIESTCFWGDAKGSGPVRSPRTKKGTR